VCTTTVYHLEINCYPKICDLAVVLCKVLDDTRIALRVLIATKIRKFKFKKQIRVRIRIRNVNFGSGSDQKSATLRLIDGIVEKKKSWDSHPRYCRRWRASAPAGRVSDSSAGCSPAPSLSPACKRQMKTQTRQIFMKDKRTLIKTSVADPGCLLYSGSRIRIFPSRIQGQKDLGSESASKNF